MTSSSPDREPRTRAGRRLAETLSTVPHKQWKPERGLFEADILAIESEAAQEARTATLREVAAKVHAEADRRAENSAYMLDRCDGTTPLGRSHGAKGFRRSDCLTCNGENNRTRFRTWPDALFAVLAAFEKEGTR